MSILHINNALSSSLHPKAHLTSSLSLSHTPVVPPVANCPFAGAMVNLKLTAGDLVPETLGRDRSDLIEETLVGAAIVSVCVGIYIFGCARCNFSFPSPWASSLSNSLQSIRMYCCPIVVLLDHKIEWFRKRGVMPDVQVIMAI